MSSEWKNLRMRRLRHRITKREMARRLKCNESWLNLLELHDYRGPARAKWSEKYRVALEGVIAERRKNG